LIEAAGILVRWVHIAAAATLVGAFGFLVGVARPAAREAGLVESGAFASLDRDLLALGRWALGVTLGSALLDLARQAMVVSGESLLTSLAWPILGAVLVETRYGAVWLARQGFLILLAALVLSRDAERDGRDWLAFRLEAAVLAAVGLGLAGAAGHAAAGSDDSLRPLALDAVHLLATGVWLGALVPFALFLRWLEGQPEPASARAAAQATRRFSILGLAGVLLLVASGMYNAWQQVGGFASLLGTSYGHWLLAKLGLVVALLGVAGVNLLVIRPRLLAAAATGAAGRGPLVRRLRHRVLVEAGLGLLVLGMVAILGLTTPARHATIDWPLTFRFDWDATKDLPGVRTRVAVGSQLALLGLVAALLGSLVRRRHWGWVVAGGVMGTGLGLGIALPALSVDAYPTTYLRPAVTYTATSIARGGALYRTHCASCHGPGGAGDGPAGAALSPSPADLTARHTGDHTAGDLFRWLSHGTGRSAMPAFGRRLTAEEIWDTINFVRTLAAVEAARSLGPTATPTPAIVAPDFPYATGIGEPLALRDERGRASVLLVFFTLPRSAERLVRLAGLYPEIRGRRADVLGVPVRDAADVYRRLGQRPVLFPIAVDGAADAVATYGLFGRALTAGAFTDPPPPHLEFLVDRQGYLRARWIPPDPGWDDERRLLGELDRLAAEVPRASDPDEHVH
jgi:putative copper resistance protein D